MLAEDYNLTRLLYSTHPRTQKALNLQNKKFHPKVNFIKPLGFHDYINLQMTCQSCII